MTHLPQINRVVALRQRWQRAIDWLSAGGRIQMVQPWALLPAALALSIAIAAPYRWLFFVGYVWLALLLGCYAWVRVLAVRVRLTRRLQTIWAEVGDELAEEWQVENMSRLPLLWLEIHDHSNLPGYRARRVAAAGPREVQRWQTGALCSRRGVYTLGPLTMRLADPVGIFAAAWQDRSIRQLVIYPSLVRLPTMRPPRGQSGGQSRADLLQQAATPSIGGLRDYVPGDLPGRIHWPTVARTQRLMVKEFDQEKAGALWIVPDLCQAAYPLVLPAPAQDTAGMSNDYLRSSMVAEPGSALTPDSLVELVIVLAGSLAAQALSEGRMVGLLADDGKRHMVSPDQGPRQLWRILGALVELQATGTTPPAQLLMRGPGAATSRSSGAAVALVTPDMSGAWLGELAAWQAARAGGAMALLALPPAARADELLGRLAGIGAAGYAFALDQPLTTLRPTRPRPVLRVSPLGRVRAT